MQVCVLIVDEPVFPIDPGWQPVRTSSWWWCICWNETPSPAPASGGLCKLPCISPSSAFCLHVWEKKQLVKFSALFLCHILRHIIGLFIQRRRHATTGPISSRIFTGLFLNPHLSAHSIDTQIGPFHLSVTTTVQWISKEQGSDSTPDKPHATPEIRDRKHAPEQRKLSNLATVRLLSLFFLHENFEALNKRPVMENITKS